MDTTESRTLQQPPTEIVYDGFISYSHAADDLLAPRLQAAGLQRFANPRTRGADVTSLDAGMRTER